MTDPMSSKTAGGRLVSSRFATGRSIGLVAVAAAFVLGGCALLPPDLPPNPKVTNAVWLDQNWSDTERFWFHHATQGTSTFPVPYDWFVALEQPQITLFESPLLIEPDYMSRFGFIPSPKTPAEPDAPTYGYLETGAGREVGSYGDYDPAVFDGNPHGLPVGFAKTRGYEDPVTGRPVPDQIGLTCAGCHTGHMVYKGTSIRVDGGPAITDLGKFRTAFGLALFYTEYLPFRFSRFADRVLGPDHTPAQRAVLKEQFKTTVARLRAAKDMFDVTAKDDVEEGFARLDALNRIGNQVFVTDLTGAPGFDETVNIAPTDAPVNYPQTWDTSWFQWVQYDGSIMQPMVRNAGEAMGVSARVNLSNPDRTLYASTVEVKEIYHMESLLAGDNPFTAPVGFKGLMSPEWPEDILGDIDRLAAARGKTLYQVHCQDCHLPPVNDPDGGLFDPSYWTTPNAVGERYLKLPLISVDKVGTDPGQAAVLVNRKMKVPDWLEVDPDSLCNGPGGEPVTEASFAAALGYVVEATANQWYDENGISPADRERMNGNRPNCLQAEFVYKARPLNGIWATPPYLHNGAVPDLYSMLLPAPERPQTFCLGDRNYDPEKVGYVRDCPKGAFKLDTTIKGNLNTGHQFTDEGSAVGRLGPAFTEQQRRDLVEYLKTL